MAARSLRSTIATLGAHEKWARCPDRKAATAALREGFDARFWRQADPDGAAQAQIDAIGADTAEGKALVKQLEGIVQQYRKVYFLRLAMASARARAGRRRGGDSA